MMTRRCLFIFVSLCILALVLSFGTAAPSSAGASFTVDSTADAPDAAPGDGACATLTGACTLRAAVQETNALLGADTISVPGGVYTLTIASAGEDGGASGDLDITDGPTITGAGAAVTIVDGGALDRVFEVVSAGLHAEISGVTVRNGFAPGEVGGGGIVNSGYLTLNASTVSGNTANNGGGIANGPGATLTLTDSTVSGNNAAGNAGGIGNLGTITITNSNISNNSGAVEGGGVAGPGTWTVTGTTISGNHAGGQGGGIAVPPSGSLSVSGSTISGNDAVLNGGGIAVGGTFTISGSAVTNNVSQAHGGGIFAAGGTVTSSTISGNVANEAAGFGGGVYSAGPMTVTDSTVGGNRAWLAGGLANFDTMTVMRSTISGNTAQTLGSALGGGGIGSAGPLILDEITVSGNNAVGTGGGIGSFGPVTVSRSTISGNNSGFAGGGIASASGALTVTNSTISGNSSAGNGGGLTFAGELVSLNNVTITNNSADSDANSSGDGGGISTPAGATTLANTIIAGNTDAGGQAPDCSGLLSSEGYNLIQSTAGCVIAPGAGDVTGPSAGLGPLADNGGPTLTHALVSGSPAIDAGNPIPPGGGGGVCAADDQRGVLRPRDGNKDGLERCDIGAFEVLPDERDVRELRVAFDVKNSNTSGLACPSDDETYTVRGHIRGPRRALYGPAPRVVTIYLYGLETGEWNWRFTEVPGYNWPAEMAKAGHVTLTIDQLGYGESGHPHGLLTCLGSLADIMHQITGQLRDGAYTVLDGDRAVSFQKVVVAGHDVGGVAAQVQAYSYKDIDGLIVMGWSEQGGTPYILTLFARTLATECATGGQNPHDDTSGGGYFFMAFDNEADREPLFDDMDPRVEEAALALKHKNPCGYLMPIPEALDMDRARLREVTAPVLLLYSNTDPVFARSGAAGGSEQQAGHYCAGCDVTTVYAGTGHFPMLERSVDEYRGEVSRWLCAHGLVSEAAGLGGCQP